MLGQVRVEQMLDKLSKLLDRLEDFMWEMIDRPLVFFLFLTIIAMVGGTIDWWLSN